MKIKVKSDGHDLTFTDRTAWALCEIIKSNERGVSTDAWET